MCWLRLYNCCQTGSSNSQRMPNNGWRTTLRVLNASRTLLAAIENAETSQRGYLLTGDNSYFQPYSSALSDELHAREELRQLTLDNGGQQARLARLSRLVENRLSLLDSISGLYRTDGPEAAFAAVGTGEGNRVMVGIRGALSDVEKEEYRLLNDRTKEAEAQVRLRGLWRMGGALALILLGIGGVVNEWDIRNHERAGEALRSSEDRFRTLANAIPQLCWMANADGWIFWYNQRWYDFTGKTPQEMEGESWQSVHSPEVLPTVLASWGRAVAEGKPWEMVFPLRAADGTFHSFLTRVMPVRDPVGKVFRWFGTNTDITAQRKTEEALRENQERLRAAQKVARIGTFEWNLQTGTKQRTPELEALYGPPRTGFDASQSAWEDRICPEDRDDVVLRMQQAMETGSFEAEWRVIWPDGAVHWLFGRASVTKDDSGKPLRLVGALTDVTERKQAELEVLRMNAELEQRVHQRTLQFETANRELEAFAYSVSHDLRAPLRGIDGWSLALLEDYAPQLDDVARGYLNRVRAETQHMGHLIDDMLQLSRVNRGEMKPVQVDLSALAQKVAVQLRDAEPERSMAFIVEPALVANGDARLLEIALTNLFSNAVKFTGKRDKGLIEFGQLEIQGEKAFYVRDNGAGFDMAYAGALFGAFQRLHTTSEFPGTGVGLAIVQRVVRRHGGRVWCEAAVNSGATFYFTLGASV